MPISVDLAHNILPSKNHAKEAIRLFLRPKISENVPYRGWVIVAAKRNAVPLQKAWLLFPPRSAVIAGNAAAIITASNAEMKAVRFNMKKATQKRVDLPAQGFFRRGVLAGSAWDFSWSRAAGECRNSSEDMSFWWSIWSKVRIRDRQCCLGYASVSKGFVRVKNASSSYLICAASQTVDLGGAIPDRRNRTVFTAA